MGDNFHQRTIEWMDRVQTADEEWQDMLTSEHMLSGGGTFQPVILEVDGSVLGQTAFKYGVQETRMRTGITSRKALSNPIQLRAPEAGNSITVIFAPR